MAAGTTLITIPLITIRLTVIQLMVQLMVIRIPRRHLFRLPYTSNGIATWRHPIHPTGITAATRTLTIPMSNSVRARGSVFPLNRPGDRASIMKRSRLAILALGLFAAGCVTFPTGPSVMALPGGNRNFEEFRADDNECRAFAANSAGGSSAQQASMDAGAASAVIGTIVGAAAGAAIGGSSSGAAVGAGSGLLIGSAIGTSSANYSGYAVQQRYDIGYTQCMYAKGHKVPVSGEYAGRSYTSRPRYAPPPAPGTNAPPAQGTYAPPPAQGTDAPPPAQGTYAPPPAPGTSAPPPPPR
jgi:hypothetical protein